jgi:5-methylcytosine-specific restriction endonuclease McrA
MSELLSLNIDLQVLAGAVENVCLGQTENGPVVFVQKTSDFSKVRFATKALRDLFHGIKSEDDVWKTKDAILYEIEILKDSLTISCCYRDKGISSAYKKDFALLSSAFSPNCEKNSSGKVVLQKWILCPNALNQVDVRNELQSFFSKELPIWENGLFVILKLNPPYELTPPSSPDSHYPNPEDIGNVKDGEVRDIHSDVYERNPKNRVACLNHFGYKCQICGFDFSTFYGPEFAGKIEVHHIDPLCRTKSAQPIDPVKDLIPVCSNCHTALHSKKGGQDEVYLPDELKAMIKRKKKK